MVWKKAPHLVVAVAVSLVTRLLPTTVCLLLLLCYDGTGVHGFATERFSSSSSLLSRLTTRRARSHIIRMVRNIDLPECIVFYGVPDSLLLNDPGTLSLLHECHDTATAVVVIPSVAAETQTQSTSPSSSSSSLLYSKLPVPIHYHVPLSRAPNPLDLYTALNAITVQPRPFGGSSGFGAKQYADPERIPLAARTVVLCQTVDQTRAARYCGMRVLCFTDNDLADAIILPEGEGAVDFYLDDIATPGSFWLNPPNPRDDQGNKVDVEQWIKRYNNNNLCQQQQQHQQQTQESTTSNRNNEVLDDDDLSDDELQRMLADLSRL